MLSFRPRASENIGARLIAALKETVPFCPSLGECQTTLSHPASTSHRSLSPEEKNLLNIDEALLRISCGIEPTDWLIHQFRECLQKIG
jgi:cystathionine beta-lyase/cystathionine gamma-synthase